MLSRSAAFLTFGSSSVPLPRRATTHSQFALTCRCSPKASLQTAATSLDDDEQQTFTITPPESGKRLDKLLASRYPNVSRTYLQTLLSTGNVLVDSQTPSKSQKSSTGQIVQVTFVTPQRDLPITPEAIPLEILHEDEHIIVVNKPAGMVIHPAPANWTGTLVHALTHRYEDIAKMGGPRPGIVHRLDKGTTGVIVVARNVHVQGELMRLFAERKVQKEYIAITVGNPAGSGCIRRTICAPIGRGNDHVRMGIVEEERGGKYAMSRVSVMGSDSRGFLHVVKINIETGRTHQIRVHMQHAGAPVLGDELYGALDVNHRFRTSVQRPMLHARCVKFEHPVSGEVVEVCARMGEDMRGVIERSIIPGFEESTTWGADVDNYRATGELIR